MPRQRSSPRGTAGPTSLSLAPFYAGAWLSQAGAAGVLGQQLRNPAFEVAFIVDDRWQNKGVGRFLLKHLMRTARRNGIRGFTAEILVENKAMQAVVNQSNTKLKSKVTRSVIGYEMNFE